VKTSSNPPYHRRISTALAALWLPLTLASAQGTFQSLTITFDGPPVIAPGTGRVVQQYYESGLSFTPIDPNAPFSGFERYGPSTLGFADNGTVHLTASLGDSLKFSFINSLAFDLYSVDLAEYSTVVPDAVTVHFLGYRHDGSIVTTDFTTDGIIDGTGPLADFQTFYFGPEFTDLDRVEIPTYRWSLDNLVVSIPEPATGALAIVGAALLGVRFRKRKMRP
jgi:PEP-CTERM motif